MWRVANRSWSNDNVRPCPHMHTFRQTNLKSEFSPKKRTFFSVPWHFVIAGFHCILIMYNNVLGNFLNISDLSEDFRRFSKSCLNARWTFPNIFRKFPKIIEYCRRVLKKIRTHTPTNLRAIYGTKLSFTRVDKIDILKCTLYTCQLFLRCRREIFVLGVLGFLKTTRSFP